MSLEKIAHNIKKAENGIYYSESESHVSYPEDGNYNCLQIEEDSFWFKHRNNIIANSVRKHSPNKTFFDIGGGNGFVAKRLQNDGIKTILVEPGKRGAINANKRGDVMADITSAEDLNEEQRIDIKNQLKDILGNKLSLNYKVDKKIIGGLIIKVGSKMIDTSLANKINKLKIAMKGA